MDFAKAVRDLRSALGDSQQAFAARLGISMRAIANYEKDREPTGRALYQLSKLAREFGRPDLAVGFSAALSKELKDAVEPLTAEEKAWSNATIALLRNSDVIDWRRLGRSVVSNLEKLAKKREDPNLDAVLLEARYRLTASAEHQLESLAKARQGKSGETYEKAYSEVLLENPHLYEQYLQERATAARGTSLAKTMALSHMKKGAKPK
jgi:transcriptional regulator with XRE-family HTH domain